MGTRIRQQFLITTSFLKTTVTRYTESLSRSVLKLTASCTDLFLQESDQRTKRIMGQLESIEIDGIGDFDTHSALNGDLTLKGVANFIKSGQVKNIVVLCGAGISVSCGIPDFRTPGTGLYYNLQKYNLPEPESMFDLSYFSQNPEPFYRLVLVCFCITSAMLLSP